MTSMRPQYNASSLAEEQVSAWLTHNKLNFSSFIAGDSRAWTLKVRAGERDVSLVLQCVTGLFSVSVQVRARDGSDRYLEACGAVAPRFPYVKVVPHRSERGEQLTGQFWLRAEAPIDLDTPPHLLPNTIGQLIGVVFLAAVAINDDLGDRLDVVSTPDSLLIAEIVTSQGIAS